MRVRVTKLSSMPIENWSLDEKITSIRPQISVFGDSASLTNSKINARISKLGKLSILSWEGKILLEEYFRNHKDILDPKYSVFEVEAWEFKPILGGDFRLTSRSERLGLQGKIFGMGQYQ